MVAVVVQSFERALRELRGSFVCLYVKCCVEFEFGPGSLVPALSFPGSGEFREGAWCSCMLRFPREDSGGGSPEREVC